MSHLTDASQYAHYMCGNSAVSSINFCKYVILHCNGDLNVEIEEEKLWNEFMQTPNYKG